MVTLKKQHSDWKPLKNKVFKDAKLAEKIHQEGYAVLPLLSDEIVEQLKAIYAREHSLNVENGGMFYSVYSTDNEYRMRVHQEIKDVLTPIQFVHITGFTISNFQ